MTFLESLLKTWFASSRVQVHISPMDDSREVRVRFSDRDWALMAVREKDAVAAARELVPRRGARRRLHWGRCRPRKGMLRLEQRGRFGAEAIESPGYVIIQHELGAP